MAATPIYGQIGTIQDNATFTGNVTLGDGGDGDSVTFNSSGGITYTPAATWTFTGNQTISGTWADLGTVTTVDIDGGTMDNVSIGANTQGNARFNKVQIGGGTAPAYELDGKKSYNGDITWYLWNTNAGASATARHYVQSDGGGDAYFGAIAGSVSFTWGVDNSDGDKFKFAAHGGLGANYIYESTSDRVTMLNKFAIASNTPAASDSTGVTGDLAFSTGYVYVCVAADTWIRTAATTW